MRTDCVVLASPILNDDFCLHQIVEELDIEAFVAQSAIERLVIAILPRAPRFDIECLRADAPQPFSNSFRSELASIIRTNVIRHATSHHQVGEDFENIFAVQATSNFDRNALTSELINHREHADLLSISRAVLDEIIRPHMIAILWSQPNARAVIQPLTPAFRLFLRNFQAFTPPDAKDTLVIHMPPFRLQQRRDPLIPIASKPGCQPNDGRGQCILIIVLLRLTPLR